MRQESSLWIGNDLEQTVPALHVNCQGKALRKLATAAVSVAVDTSRNLIYFNDGYYTITSRRLNSLDRLNSAIGPMYAGDMTFADGKLWVANAIDKSLDWIDPTSGVVSREIQLPFRPRGIAYDGAGFWLTAFEDDDHLVRVTSTVAPCPCGETEECELGQVDIDLDLEFPVFGLAWDNTDGTIWAGSDGRVIHLATSGQVLGDFKVGDGRFVGALDFQGPGKPIKK